MLGGPSSLIDQAIGGDLEMVELLLEAEADVLAADEDETTSLMGAVKGNFGEIAKVLF